MTPTSLEVTRPAPGLAVVEVAGRFDAPVALEVRRAIDTFAVGGVDTAVVDLTEATFVDSAGLAAVVHAHRVCESVGGTAVVCEPRSADARRVFELTMLDRVLRMVTVRSAGDAG